MTVPRILALLLILGLVTACGPRPRPAGSTGPEMPPATGDATGNTSGATTGPEPTTSLTDAPTAGSTGDTGDTGDGECPLSTHCGEQCPAEPLPQCSAVEALCLEWMLPVEACEALRTRCEEISPTDAAVCASLAMFAEKVAVCGKGAGDGGIEAECLCVLACDNPKPSGCHPPTVAFCSQVAELCDALGLNDVAEPVCAELVMWCGRNGDTCLTCIFLEEQCRIILPTPDEECVGVEPACHALG